jgi:hypothetical protein
MALTRKMLTALGIDDTKAEQIIDAHTETVDGLKNQIAELKDKTGGDGDLQKKLEESEKKVAEYEQKITSLEQGDGYKEKYTKLDGEFKEFKKTVDAEKQHANREAAYRTALKEAGVSEKRIDSIVKLKKADIDALEFDGDKIKDADKLSDSIKSEWSDFIVTHHDEGGKPVDHPEPGKPITSESLKGMSVEDINKNWDAVKTTLKSVKGD